MRVFSNKQEFGGAFRADNLQMRLGGQALDGMGVQSVQFTFTQQINMMFEINSNPERDYVYYVGGRAQGTASVSRIVGPAPVQLGILERLQDMCNPADVDFDARAGCAGRTGGARYRMKSAVLTTIGAQVNANDVVVNETLQVMFLNLDSA